MRESIQSGPAPDPAAFLSGGGEMGERIRSFDWARTSLGRPQDWPQSLRSAVSILLPSKAQIVLFWGPDLITLYNDAYRPVFGAKHPHALGLPAWESWRELWNAGFKELLEGVVATGEAYWATDRLFVVNRFGYTEETYFDISYDPVRNESGQVGGVFCIVSDTTARVVGARRLKTLRELGARTIEVARTTEDACHAAASVLAANPYDVPFSVIYLLESDGSAARLAGVTGLAEGTATAPRFIELAASASEPPAWPLRQVKESNRSQVITGLEAALGMLPGGAWPEATQTAVVLPIRQSGQERLAGFLVAGVNPRRAFDQEYHDFLELVSAQIATAIANARAFEQEKRRAEALAELDRAKTAFFSNVSHEFRTPLTLMLGPLEDLLSRGDGGVPRAVAEQLEIVSRNALRLLRLVNTLLDFSRIEAGRARAVYRPTDLAALTADLASVFRSACDRAGLRLIVDCPPLDELVYVDREMWEKVVLNLLSNAFKFTFEGEIVVRLQQTETNALVRVRDTGSGIPAAELPHVFERFHRIRNSRGRTHEGSGIGLALVQELVKLHAGSIYVESTPGAGTEFVVALPLGSAHLPPDQIGEETSPAPAGAGATPYVEEALRWLPDEGGSDGQQRPPLLLDDTVPIAAADLRSNTPGDERSRVLIADDNADMRKYLAGLLASRYRVEAVGDGVAALIAARGTLPDLIVTDVMMPRLDAFGLLEELRADPLTCNIPIILLSARAGEESRVEGMEAGADDYLVKPFSARELLARVSSHLQIAQLRRESDRRKDEFLATLAHELRNPLAPLSNGLEVMKLLTTGDQSLEEVRAMMERQLAQMVRLIDDLMDVSRISRGKLELRKEPLLLAEVVEQAVETARPLVGSRDHSLTVAISPEPIRVHGDKIRLAQAVSNLLTNAAKYTEPGGRIHLAVERQGANALVRVRDNGIGIPSHLLPRIFDPFMQVESSLGKAQGGLGIGLTLVKQLLEMHEGTIEVTSGGPGRGSEFVVCLPARPSPEGAQR